MIAIESLQDTDIRGMLPRARSSGNVLITMGSPYSSLYSHYFSHYYTPSEPPIQKNGSLKAWINIFRADDFVGTRIDNNAANHWPKNECVKPNGHTGYWEDHDVLNIINDHTNILP